MSKKWAQLYRVDTVPLWLWPFFALYAVGFAIPYLAYLILVRLTSRMEWVGDRDWVRSPSIHAWWHRYGNPYFLVFMPLHRHVFMSHPYWYMAPTHLLFKLVGLRKIILGSTGHDGRIAANRVAEELKRGSSTVMTPDGPEGPAGLIRKGVFHLALFSGVPIVPVRFEVRGAFQLPGWDRKLIPLPFSKIRVVLSPPIRVTSEDFSVYETVLRAGLGSL